MSHSIFGLLPSSQYCFRFISFFFFNCKRAKSAYHKYTYHQLGSYQQMKCDEITLHLHSCMCGLRPRPTATIDNLNASCGARRFRYDSYSFLRLLNCISHSHLVLISLAIYTLYHYARMCCSTVPISQARQSSRAHLSSRRSPSAMCCSNYDGLSVLLFV